MPPATWPVVLVNGAIVGKEAEDQQNEVRADEKVNGVFGLGRFRGKGWGTYRVIEHARVGGFRF